MVALEACGGIDPGRVAAQDEVGKADRSLAGFEQVQRHGPSAIGHCVDMQRRAGYHECIFSTDRVTHAFMGRPTRNAADDRTLRVNRRVMRVHIAAQEPMRVA